MYCKKIMSPPYPLPDTPAFKLVSRNGSSGNSNFTCLVLSIFSRKQPFSLLAWTLVKLLILAAYLFAEVIHIYETQKGYIELQSYSLPLSRVEDMFPPEEAMLLAELPQYSFSEDSVLDDQRQFSNSKLIFPVPAIDLRLNRLEKFLRVIFPGPDRCEPFWTCIDDFPERFFRDGQYSRFDIEPITNRVFSSNMETDRSIWSRQHFVQALQYPLARPLLNEKRSMPFILFTGDSRSGIPKFTDSSGRECVVPLLVNEATSDGVAILMLARESSWPAGGNFVDVWFLWEWEERYEKAIWTGSTTQGYWTKSNYRNKIRYKLCKFSLKHPNLVDAKLTQIVESPDKDLPSILLDEGVFHPRKYQVTEQDMLKYKYLIVVDGNSNADRFPKFLNSGSVVFRSHPIRGAETFTLRLKPWVHYIPFREDMSDLVERVEWAKKNDAAARKGAKSQNRMPSTYNFKRQAVSPAKQHFTHYL